MAVWTLRHHQMKTPNQLKKQEESEDLTLYNGHAKHLQTEDKGTKPYQTGQGSIYKLAYDSYDRGILQRSGTSYANYISDGGTRVNRK